MIITLDRIEDYCVVCNEVARRTDLSAKAKGIYYYLATLPPNWKLKKTELFNHFTEGIHSLSSAFRELERAGYIAKVRQKDKSGRFVGWQYKVYWSAKSVKTDLTENRHSENRPVGNQHLLNTYIVNTDKEINNNIYTSSPDGLDGERQDKFNAKEKFEEAWQRYPRKEGKKQALRHFQASVKSETDYKQFLLALKNYLAYIAREKIERKYIKQGQTFFNQWQDEQWSSNQTQTTIQPARRLSL